MQSFTIRDIENLTGIKAHTLRIWEQRYSFFSPKRKQSLHRIYDNEDLKTLLRISFLYHLGWKISKIASMSAEQVMEQIRQMELPDGHAGHQVPRLLEAAVDFDENAFIAIIDQISARIGFEKCITEVGYPYLSKIGLLWSTNNIIPAQEHFSSYIIQNKIIAETEKLPAIDEKPMIVLACPSGEFHELPLVFINYLLRKYGWGTIYLGFNIHKSEMEAVAALPSVRYIYIHLITNFTGTHVDDYLDVVCSGFADKKIVASGAGVAAVQRKFSNLSVLRSDEEIYRFIRSTPGAHDF